MSNIILLFICLAIGMLLRKLKGAPDNFHLAINAFIIYVSLPALTLLQLHAVQFQPSLLYAVAMPWILFLLGAAFFWSIAKALTLTPQTTGGLMLCGGLANTSFVGLPMIEAFYGTGGMAIGILIDQLGTYLVLSTLGIAIAAVYSSGIPSGREIIKRICRFPPFIALLVAIALSPVEFPPWLADVLRRLGDTLVPLALVSVGFQLQLDQAQNAKAPLAIGLMFKLVIGPLLLAILYVSLLHATGNVAKITLFESAMGPQIGASIVAIQHGLNPPLITLLVGIGITLSFLTLPIWWYALQGI
jgi:predicted permease